MTYGLQIFDASGNLTLDTSDSTIKDLGLYTNTSVTANGDITGVTIPAGAEVLVEIKSGIEATDPEPPVVEADRVNNRIRVYGGGGGFQVGLRVLDIE